MNDKPSARICQTEGLRVAGCGFEITLNDNFSSSPCAVGTLAKYRARRHSAVSSVGRMPARAVFCQTHAVFGAKLQRSIHNPRVPIRLQIIRDLPESFDYALNHPVRSRSAGADSDAPDAAQVFGIDFLSRFDQRRARAFLSRRFDQFVAVGAVPSADDIKHLDLGRKIADRLLILLRRVADGFADLHLGRLLAQRFDDGLILFRTDRRLSDSSDAFHRGQFPDVLDRLDDVSFVIDVAENAPYFRMISVAGDDDGVTRFAQLDGFMLRVMHVRAGAVHNPQPARFQSQHGLRRDAMRPNDDRAARGDGAFIDYHNAVLLKAFDLLRVMNQRAQRYDLPAVGLLDRAIGHVNGPFDPHAKPQALSQY